MQHIIYVLVNVISFIVCLVTLEVVWANLKGYWHEKNYKQCALYLAGGIVVFAIVIYVSTISNAYFG